MICAVFFPGALAMAEHRPSLKPSSESVLIWRILRLRSSQLEEAMTDSETLPDSDGDGVPDANDAFPQDIAASIDDDGDGFPDAWNESKGPADSTGGLVLDESPGGISPRGIFGEAKWNQAVFG